MEMLYINATLRIAITIKRFVMIHTFISSSVITLLLQLNIILVSSIKKNTT